MRPSVPLRHLGLDKTDTGSDAIDADAGEGAQEAAQHIRLRTPSHVLNRRRNIGLGLMRRRRRPQNFALRSRSPICTIRAIGPMPAQYGMIGEICRRVTRREKRGMRGRWRAVVIYGAKRRMTFLST